MVAVAVPRNVEHALQRFDPRLRLIWNQRRKKFEVLEMMKQSAGYFVHCFYVETADKRPIYDLGSGEFILSELRSRNAANRFRNEDDFMAKMVDQPVRDLETEKVEAQESLSAEIVKDSLKDFQGRTTGPLPKKLSVEK
jgi:hypothetical protein